MWPEEPSIAAAYALLITNFPVLEDQGLRLGECEDLITAPLIGCQVAGSSGCSNVFDFQVSVMLYQKSLLIYNITSTHRLCDMPERFLQKKARILESLYTSSQDYTDLSPKGSLDEDIRELCDEINAWDGFVTTSSCAGRISVFLDGPSRTSDGHSKTSFGGKGGGQWLYVSHRPLEMSGLDHEGALYATLGISLTQSVTFPPPSGHPRFVHLKFEPMILHILASSLKNAQLALTAALSAGFRESGVSSIAGEDQLPMVAVRSQGIALESVIAFYDDTTDSIKSMVPEDYLRTLVRLANQRFVSNVERKGRFRSALLRSLSEGSSPSKAKDGREWEPAHLRAERKRAEGLQRRQEQMSKHDKSHSKTKKSDGAEGDEILNPGPSPN